jgi:hypothetical protein
MDESDKGPVGFEVGTGRGITYYKEAGRVLALNTDHSEAAGITLFEICVEPMPRWYSARDFSDAGEVSSSDRVRIMANTLRELKVRGFRCEFQNRDGEPFL